MERGLAIITGADGGMGMEETLEVAKAGYHVIMACYSYKKAEPKCNAIIKESGNKNVEIMQIDLSNLSNVASFADRLIERGEQIDLLMNNAGTMGTGKHYTVDDLEHTVSVNYVGPYLLTRKLLPLMHRGSRIVNMSSCSYVIGKLSFPEFFTEGRKGFWQRILVYANTKKAITLFTLELAERLKDKGIMVNAADPWIVNTEIIRMQMFFDPLTDIFFRPFINTPRQGADTAIRLLLDDECANRTGTFCRSGKPVKLSKKMTNHPQKTELWNLTEDIVKNWL